LRSLEKSRPTPGGHTHAQKSFIELSSKDQIAVKRSEECADVLVLLRGRVMTASIVHLSPENTKRRIIVNPRFGKARVVKRSNALEKRSYVQRMCIPSNYKMRPRLYPSENTGPRRTEHDCHPAASANRCGKVARAGLLRVPGQHATSEDKKCRATAVLCKHARQEVQVKRFEDMQCALTGAEDVRNDLADVTSRCSSSQTSSRKSRASLPCSELQRAPVTSSKDTTVMMAVLLLLLLRKPSAIRR
jgi:hypothetical protein